MFGKLSFCAEVVIRTLSLILGLKELVDIVTFLSHEPQALWVYGYLTIIPRARMGSESIAHEAEGRMDYWLRGHEG